MTDVLGIAHLGIAHQVTKILGVFLIIGSIIIIVSFIILIIFNCSVVGRARATGKVINCLIDRHSELRNI